QAIELESGNARAYNARGMTHFFAGAIDKAITEFDQAIFLNPRLKYAWNNLGFAYLSLKPPNAQEAVKAQETATELDRDFAEAWFGLGVAHAAQKEHGKAIDALKRATEINPHYVQAYSARARSYSALKQENLAEKDRKKVKE